MPYDLIVHNKQLSHCYICSEGHFTASCSL